LAFKIKDFVTRDRSVLMSTFNTSPKPESMLQNQRLLLEALCDIRHCLVELLFRTSWLKKADKFSGIVPDGAFTEREKLGLSRREEKALSHEDKVKVISKRAARKEASTDEDVEAF